MSGNKPLLADCEHVFLVEGYSDLHFLSAFLRHLNRDNGVYIHQFTGKKRMLNPGLLSDFLTPKVLAEKKTIGLLLDADENAAATAQAVRDRMHALTDLQLTEASWHEQPDGPRIGFFVMPDGASPGTIETLLWNGFADDERHRSMKGVVLDFQQKMTGLGWKGGETDKGRIAAFLSAAHPEDPRLGPGAREGAFNLDTPGLSRLRRFLEVLPLRAT
jgi:hypothetical protein